MTVITTCTQFLIPLSMGDNSKFYKLKSGQGEIIKFHRPF